MRRLHLIPPEAERKAFRRHFRGYHGWRTWLASLSVFFVILTASNAWWLDLCDLGVLILAWGEYCLHVLDDTRADRGETYTRDKIWKD